MINVKNVVIFCFIGFTVDMQSFMICNLSMVLFVGVALGQSENFLIKGDLQTIFRYSYLKVYKFITLGTKFKNL